MGEGPRVGATVASPPNGAYTSSVNDELFLSFCILQLMTGVGSS